MTGEEDCRRNEKDCDQPSLTLFYDVQDPQAIRMFPNCVSRDATAEDFFSFSNLKQEHCFVFGSEAVLRLSKNSRTTNYILISCYDACDLEHLLSSLTKGDSRKIHHNLDGFEPLSVGLRFRWFLSPVDSPAIDSEYQRANLLWLKSN